ncbi:alpha/beta-hydrolase, partial [Teratosphaeria nubilosa]
MAVVLIMIIAILWLTLVSAQFSPTPKWDKVIRSRFGNDVTISYKEVPGCLCESTPGVRSWSGYVHIPPHALADLGTMNQSWPINTFFWYFESRKDPTNDPTIIWINGGPGGSSSGNALGYNGPCKVHPDANSTYLNPWSWNNEANLLYFDQPVQVGLSYDTFQNISYDLISGNFTLLNESTGIPGQNTTLHVGTWPSTDTYKTSFGSVNAAYAAWHFFQAWIQEFPEHKTTSLSLSGVSYGGKYAPAIFDFFATQNARIANGTWNTTGETFILPLNTLIIENGCVDLPGSWFSYPVLAAHNTYNISGVNRSTVDEMWDNLNKKDGCLDQAYNCGNLSLLYDPLAIGVNESVNHVCFEAGMYCDRQVQGLWGRSNRSFYDITLPGDFSRGPPFSLAYLQREWVQEGLGMAVNWTRGSPWVAEAFRREGDFAHPGWVGKLGDLLARGVKVAFVYGDKDFLCNWVGGEALSLAIDWDSTAHFRAAGYAPIQTNSSYTGGLVRQYGNLSFSRIYEAGHGVSGEQPDTVQKLVMRLLRNQDVATGLVSDV